MYIIGISGKSGSGKSYFSKLLQDNLRAINKTVAIINFDSIGHIVVKEISYVQKELKKAFGDKILDENGLISRKKLSDLVFNDSSALSKLNSITLPYMCKQIDNILEDFNNYDYVIFDYALLPKIQKYFNMCNYKVLIKSDICKRKERIILRDKISEEKFQKREISSIVYSEFDFNSVINNNVENKIMDLALYISTVITTLNDNKKIAYYPGSFDPITYGHINIIEKALKLGFDEIVVAITANSSKKATMFTLQERYNMVKDLYKYNNQIKVILVESGKASVKIAEEHNCQAMIRGLRNVTDFEYELNMSKVNYTISDVETIFLTADHKYDFISSSTARELAYLGEDISFYVPPLIRKQIIKKLNNK